MDDSGRGRPGGSRTETPDKATPSPDNAGRSRTGSENPFIEFRRYADEKINSMLESVMGFPSMTVPLFLDKNFLFDENDNHRRQARNVEEDAYSNNTHWPLCRSGRHRRDTEFGFNSFFDGFPLSFGFPSALSGNMLFDENDQTWPLAYLLFSSYSPLYLERSQSHDHHHKNTFRSLFSDRKSTVVDPNEPHWRDAFEDLLRVTNGQDMLDLNAEPERQTQSADKWIRGLIQRGSLGSNWRYLGPESYTNGAASEKLEQYDGNRSGQKLLSSQSTREIEAEASSPETELDLYGRFLEDVTNAHERYSRAFADSPLMRLLDEERKCHMRHEETSRETTEESVHSKDWLEYTSDGNKNLLASQSTTEGDSATGARVISTMTRSVRRTLADGSISTKTVKTKRFADGREESDESVEVIPPPSAKTNAYQNRDSDEENQTNGRRGGRGWFWTR